MAVDSNALIQALIDGGITPAASRVIANALANAATPQFSQSRDIADATPRDQLRLIDSDTRKYLLANLDYSSEQPYQTALQSSPGQYAGGPADHPYKDSQPVAPIPPLSRNAVVGGDYITVDNNVQDSAQVSTVSLKLGTKSGVHLRINPATKSTEAVPINFNSPQGLVTASVNNSSTATNIELVVRALSTVGVVLSDGTVANVLGWLDESADTPYRWAVPPGAILPFGNVLASPLGWLLCDGTAYSREVFADLFSAIGTTHGAGDGTTTFNVPDLRGYFVRGLGTAATIGANSDGTTSSTLGNKQQDQYRSHDHPFTEGAPWRISAGTGSIYGGLGGGSFVGTTNPSGVVGFSGGAETRPKNMALPYYIKT